MFMTSPGKDTIALLVLVLGFALLSSSHLARGQDSGEPCVGRWSFEGDGAAMARDSVGSHHGRLHGKPTQAAGVVGQCLVFDGDKDHISVPDAPALSFTSSTFSLSAWVNVYMLDRGQQMIAAKNTYAADQREWSLMVDTDNHFRFYLRHNGWRTVGSHTVPQPGHWYHLIVTVDNGDARLYVNGEIEGRAALGTRIADTAAPMSIGAVNNAGRLMQAFLGAIDEVALTRTVLDPEEIRTMSDRQTTPHEVPAVLEPYPLWSGGALPKAADIPVLRGVEFHVIKRWEPQTDGYHWLHGVALAWHHGRLHASFGHNEGRENTASEQARGRQSSDGGGTWGEVFTIDVGKGDLGVSHGVLLPHDGRLWAFQGAFFGDFQRTHTRAYLLDEKSGRWISRGVVVGEGFWPMQEPINMPDGNWIMGGARIAKGYEMEEHLPAVAISHGDDFTQWDLVVIETAPGVSNVWGESTVYVEGSRVINVSRWGAQARALVAVSEDGGRTWTESCPSNLPMATSKPYTGTLSTGQHYLVCTTTADSGGRRHPLTIAVTRPGELAFSQVYVIRDAWFPEGPGESAPDARLSYPHAVEYGGKLYVGYSNAGSRGGNRNSAELAIVPVEALRVD